MRVPEVWLVGQAQVEIRRRDGVGVLKIITTDDDPSAWARGGELFHGQLYGKTGEGKNLEFDTFLRWWKLWCGNVTLHVYYRCAAHACECERLEVDEIVCSLLPREMLTG